MTTKRSKGRAPAAPPIPSTTIIVSEEAMHPIIRSSTPVRVFDNPGDVAAVAVFPDRRRMAMNSSDGMVRLWDLEGGVMLKELEGRGDPMRDMALSRDGQLIASSDNIGYVTAWHADTGRSLTQTFKAHSNTCSLDFSPDGTTLATGSTSEYAVKLWSTVTWGQQGVEINCEGYVNCLRYSPSGELLAIATTYSVYICNAATQQHTATLGQGVPSMSLAWTPDGKHLLSGDSNDTIIREWNTSTWTQVADIWKGRTDYPWRFAVNCNGTVVASPTTDNCLRLWRLSDRRTIAIFQHSDSPCCVTFSMDGKHIFAGGKDKKISQWAVPEHAWPEDASKGDRAQDRDTSNQSCDTKIFAAMNMAVRNACISGDLSIAEELLTQEIDADGDNYCSYANRSVVMARKLDWDHAVDDATKSLGIRPSLMGYISKGIALCGKKQVRDGKRAFDLAFAFTNGDSKTNHLLFIIKAIALFNANQHTEAMRRVRELAAACPDTDITLACRTIEVYLHIQLGNNALDRACPSEAADHFTAAVDTGTFLSKSAVHSKHEEFVVLFGCDFTSLWQTANQKRCHALFRAGKLTEVFDAYRNMAEMSDEATRASCLNWSIGFIQELSISRDYTPNADAIPDMRKYDEENDSISDIDSDIDQVSRSDGHLTLEI